MHGMTTNVWDRMTAAERDAWRTAHGTWPADTPDGALARFAASKVRVEIVWRDGVDYWPAKNGRTRGRIGRSTGWAPTWIVLLTARSIGGHPIDANEIASIRPV